MRYTSPTSSRRIGGSRERPEPRLIEGGLAVDDRGTVAFVNDFDLAPVRRFYVVSNHRQGLRPRLARSSHERKFVTVLRGLRPRLLRADRRLGRPFAGAAVSALRAFGAQPSVVEIPEGYANGFMSLTDDVSVMFFSSSTLEESHGDDVRYPARHWDPWHVEER